VTYATDRLFEEVAYVAYHFHWSFEEILELAKEDRGYALDTELTADDWVKVIADFKAKVMEETGEPFPQAPKDQVWAAIGAVFGSWMNQRAKTYRRLNNIPPEWGTAVNLQAMVFGNMGDDCATGVAFTRDPSTGHNDFYGEYLVNAQGEDVVAGIRTPQNLTLRGKEMNHSKLPAMEEVMPEVFEQLDGVRHTLEAHYKDMQDIEFTVQRGTLYMLQTRTGKRTAPAALKIAVDMVQEGLISEAEAVEIVGTHPRHRLGVAGSGAAVQPAVVAEATATADQRERAVLLGHRLRLQSADLLGNPGVLRLGRLAPSR